MASHHQWTWLHNQRTSGGMAPTECVISLTRRAGQPQPRVRFSPQLMEELGYPEGVYVGVCRNKLAFTFCKERPPGGYRLSRLVGTKGPDGKPVRGQLTLDRARSQMRDQTGRRVLFVPGRYTLNVEHEEGRDLYIITFRMSPHPVDLYGRPLVGDEGGTYPA